MLNISDGKLQVALILGLSVNGIGSMDHRSGSARRVTPQRILARSMLWWTDPSLLTRAIDLMATPSSSSGRVLSRADTGLCDSVASEVYTRWKGRFARLSRSWRVIRRVKREERSFGSLLNETRLKMSWISPKVELLHLKPRLGGASVSSPTAASVCAGTSRLSSLAKTWLTVQQLSSQNGDSGSASGASPSSKTASWTRRTNVMGLQGHARMLTSATQVIFKDETSTDWEHSTCRLLTPYTDRQSDLRGLCRRLRFPHSCMRYSAIRTATDSMRLHCDRSPTICIRPFGKTSVSSRIDVLVATVDVAHDLVVCVDVTVKVNWYVPICADDMYLHGTKRCII